MTLHPKTLSALQHQGRRMSAALAEKDRKEVEIIHRRVDDILDKRPRPVGEATDGEVIYDDAGTWVLAQLTETVNTTDVPERVLPMSMFGSLDDPGDDGTLPPNGGGVGLLDRP